MGSRLERWLWVKGDTDAPIRQFSDTNKSYQVKARTPEDGWYLMADEEEDKMMLPTLESPRNILQVLKLAQS